MQVFWTVRGDFHAERSISGLGLEIVFVRDHAIGNQVKISRKMRRERKTLSADWIPSPPEDGGLG